MKLLFTTNGIAQLLGDADKVVWSSDTDDEFKDEFEDDFLGEDDVEDIFEYLVDHDIVEDEDVEHIEIFEDSLVGDDDENDEDNGAPALEDDE